MHRAVLTPKRLISNLFAISSCIVKVIPLAEIAADSLLPVDFGHGQFTRVDRDFILQKTILSRQLWKQTARPKYRPPPRGSSTGPSQSGGAGSGELPTLLPSPPRSVGAAEHRSPAGGGTEGRRGEGLFPASRENPITQCVSCPPLLFPSLSTPGSPATSRRGDSWRPGMPTPWASGSVPAPIVAGWWHRLPELPSLFTFWSASPVPLVPSGKA